MKINLTTCAFLLASGFVAACGSSSSGGSASHVGGAVDASGEDTQAAQQSHQSADQSTAADSSTAQLQPPMAFRLADEAAEMAFATAGGNAYNNVFRVSGCLATSVGTYSDANGTRTLNGNITFSGCTGQVVISGTESLSATYTAATASRTIDVTDNFTRTEADGRSITITSLDPTKPSSTLNATGFPANGNDTVVVVLNQHRVAKSGTNEVIFDHNITTDATGLNITNTFVTANGQTRPVTRVINSGTVTVHHNLDHFTATNTFAGVVHDTSVTSTCECPQAGTITQVITTDDNKGSYTRAYTFTACGQADVVTSSSTLKGTSNGTATVTWENCQH